MRVIERARMLADRIGDRPEQGSDPELLLDFAELQVLVKRHFRLRDRESRSVSIDEQASNQSYWDRLFAAVTDEAPSTTVPLEPVPSTHRELREEGYTHVADVLSAGEAAAISAVVDHVVHAGWPPVFAFLHSSLWGVPKRLEPFVSGVLGDDYEMLDAVWAWRVPANSEGRGWRPHRDRCSVSVARDGTPLSITVWVALTDASPENGCIYLLPAGYDPYYRDHPEIVTVLDVQNARAVPARAGCALAWNHQVLHWGGRSSPSAARARASVAYEFRRADAMDDKPTIGRRGVPTFDERLAIVARQVVQYRELSGIDRSYVDWANDLLARRGHGGLPSGSSRHP